VKPHGSGTSGGATEQPGPPGPAGEAALAAAALREAARLVAGLTPEQLVELAAGRARLAYEPAAELTNALTGPPTAAGPAATPTAPAPRRPSRRAAAIPDADAIGPAVRAILDLRTPREVADHLDRHRYPVPALKQIVRALGPTVSTAARNRAELERNIIEGTAGYRTRSAAMSGGAWP
jgi:hypothetical protein